MTKWTSQGGWPDREPSTRNTVNEEQDMKSAFCEECEGTGVDDTGNVCDYCGGTGSK